MSQACCGADSQMSPAPCLQERVRGVRGKGMVLPAKERVSRGLGRLERCSHNLGTPEADGREPVEFCTELSGGSDSTFQSHVEQWFRAWWSLAAGVHIMALSHIAWVAVDMIFLWYMESLVLHMLLKCSSPGLHLQP